MTSAFFRHIKNIFDRWQLWAFVFISNFSEAEVQNLYTAPKKKAGKVAISDALQPRELFSILVTTRECTRP